MLYIDTEPVGIHCPPKIVVTAPLCSGCLTLPPAGNGEHRYEIWIQSEVQEILIQCIQPLLNILIILTGDEEKLRMKEGTDYEMARDFPGHGHMSMSLIIMAIPSTS